MLVVHLCITFTFPVHGVNKGFNFLQTLVCKVFHPYEKKCNLSIVRICCITRDMETTNAFNIGFTTLKTCVLFVYQFEYL